MDRDEVTIVLPYPISANRYWRTFRNRMVRSKEAQTFRTKAMAACAAVRAPTYTGYVAVQIRLLPKLTKAGKASLRLMDLDNALKVTIDSLQGCVIVDDSQIRQISAEYGPPVLNGGVELTVRKFPPPALAPQTNSPIPEMEFIQSEAFSSPLR